MASHVIEASDVVSTRTSEDLDAQSQTDWSKAVNSDTAAMTTHAKHHCKQCGKALVEGRAYELGGYRWHVECFSCSVCGTQLDSDTNMLVLGNGTLVCNNCSYYCNICHKKIEDLAILTNDQAFCSACFSCRNCRRRIDDLKYARTSQGIFCMNCHNLLLARKQQRSQQRDKRVSTRPTSSVTITKNSYLREKQLPELPGLPRKTINRTPSSSTVPTLGTSPSTLDPAANGSPVAGSTTDSSNPGKAPQPQSYSSAPIVPTMKSSLNWSGTESSGNSPITNNNSEESSADLSESQVQDLQKVPTAAHAHIIQSSLQDTKDLRSPIESSFDVDNIASSDEPSRSSFKVNSAHSSVSASSHIDVQLDNTSHTSFRDSLKDAVNGVSSEFDDNVSKPRASITAKFPSGAFSTNSRTSSLRSHRSIDTVGSRSLEDSSRSDQFSTPMLKLDSPADGLSESLRSLNVSGTSDNATPESVATKSTEPEVKPVQQTKARSQSPVPIHPDVLKAVASEAPQATRTLESEASIPPILQPNTAPKPDTSTRTLKQPVEISPVNSLYKHRLSAISTKSNNSEATATQSAVGSNASVSTTVPSNIISGIDSGNMVVGVPAGSESTARSSSPAPEKFTTHSTPTKQRPSSQKLISSSEESDILSTPKEKIVPNLQYQRNSGSSRYQSSARSLHLPSPGPALSLSEAGTPEHSLASPGFIDGTSNPDVQVPQRSLLRSYSPLREREPLTIRTEERGPINSSSTLSPRSYGSLSRSASTATTGRAVPSAVFSPQTNTRTSIPTSAIPLRSHKRSHSDNPFGDFDNAYLMQALQVAQKRILELERLLRDNDGSGQSHFDAVVLERKKTIAGLEARQAIAKEELEALQDASQSDGTEAAERLKQNLQNVRADLETDIEQLVAQKEELRMEVYQLNAARDKALEESSILNMKNTQLLDMNNELTRQTIEKFGPNTLWSSQQPQQPQSLNSPQGQQKEPGAGRLWDKRRDRAKRKEVGSGTIAQPINTAPPPVQVPTEKSSPYSQNTNWQGSSAGTTSIGGSELQSTLASSVGSGTSSTNSGDGPMVTVLDAPPSSANNAKSRPSRNIWPWRRTGRGLNRVFGMDGEEEPEGEKNSFMSGGAISMLAAAGVGGSNMKGVAPAVPSILGDELETRVQLDNMTVPDIVTRCIEEVERRGLDLEGIYRKSGSKSQVDAIMEHFDTRDPSTESTLKSDISAVTSALKQYLRHLIDPVITYQNYDMYVQAGRSGDAGLLKEVVAQLPLAHRNTLQTLTEHLGVISSHGTKNLMTTRNLAVVFAPTLARDRDGSREVADMQARNDATQMLIENAQVIFG